MATAPAGAMLAKEVNLTLTTVDGTGNDNSFINISTTYKHLLASDADGDFTPLAMSVAFTSGSSDGDMVCVNVTVLADAMVERVMNFTVELTLNTEGDSLSLGNSSTLVLITDSNGN